MADIKKVTLAFVFPALSGHANIQIATLQYLLTTSDGPSLALHVLSDEPSRKGIEVLPRLARHSIAFHSLGEDYFQEVHVDVDMERHGPVDFFAKDGLKGYNTLAQLIVPNSQRYLDYFQRCLGIFQSLLPDLDLVVVDVLMNHAGEACRSLRIPYGVCSPNPSFDMTRIMTKSLKRFWKYPALWSGLSMPVPIQWIPYNIVVGIMLIKTLTSNPRVDELEKLRAAANMKGPVVRDGTELEFVLIPSVPAMEYPHEPMPKVIYAGPMLADAPDLRESHPSLARFIGRARTIHLNMGTLFRYTEDDVRAVVEAILDARARMSSRGGFQVLWKLPRKANFDVLLESLWPDEETRTAVLIQEWLEAPSISILQHPNIVISVNHGGANSVHEACLAGKPQIILPQWCDLYDFAVRVEALGHGIYANKGHDAKIDAKQFADALETVLCDHPEETGGSLKARAIEIQKACQAAGGVRKVRQVLMDTVGYFRGQMV